MREQATNFDIRISIKEAIYLLTKPHPFNIIIMCKEYGEDDDWQEVTKDDLSETNTFDEDYKTFEIWLDQNRKSDRYLIPKFLDQISLLL